MSFVPSIFAPLKAIRLFVLAGSMGGLLSVSTAILLPVSANAQSFNCRYAKKADEKLICRRTYLARLDEEMVRLFNQVMEQVPAPVRRMTRAQQDGWLRSRHQCTWNAECIALHYRARIRELDSHMVARDERRNRVRMDPRDQDYIPEELR